MKLGAHVSAAGGLDKSIDRAESMGAETIQIFASSPRVWESKTPAEENISAFREKSGKANISPIFLHAPYLVNMGGDEELLEKSIKALVGHLKIGKDIGAAGVIFHLGSHKGVGFEKIRDQTIVSIQEILIKTSSGISLIIENSAGMGSHIGSSFEEIGTLIRAVNNPRMKVCLDTQHCIAAGYNIADPEGIKSSLDEFDKMIGLSKLVVVHANDSKMELGAGVDRHENIGEGHIGMEGFENIMRYPAFNDIPFILEVPGFDKKGPDKQNLDRLKNIRSKM